MKNSIRRAIGLAIVFAFVAAACGSDSEGSESADGAVCPANLVIQTDWWPETEHGGSYQLIGADGTSDGNLFTYSGPIQEQYAVGGIETVEVRAGGDAIEFSPVQSVMATDTDITLGYVNTDDAIYGSPTVAVTGVATTLEINPQILMWDPAQLDIDRNDASTLGASGARVLHFPGVTYIDWLIAEGFIDASQSDPNYGGSPAEWIPSGGDYIQQGFATQEVFKYENLIAWKDDAPADIDYALIHNLGWETYPAMYTVLSDRLEELSPCLSVLVPVLQQAWVDYFEDPFPIGDTLITVTEAYNNYWALTPELNTSAWLLMDDLGIAGNGPDSTYGNFDDARVAGLFDQVVAIMDSNGVELPDGYDASSVVTNEFIDESIGR